VLTHPHGSTVLGALVTGVLVDGRLLAHIPHAQLLVSGCSDQHITACAPRQTLNDIGVLEGQVGLASANIPQLDGEVAGGGGENVFGGGVEEDMSDLPARAVSMMNVGRRGG